MRKIKAELIRLGENRKDLRPHIRPVLDYITKEAATLVGERLEPREVTVALKGIFRDVRGPVGGEWEIQIGDAPGESVVLELSRDKIRVKPAHGSRALLEANNDTIWWDSLVKALLTAQIDSEGAEDPLRVFEESISRAVLTFELTDPDMIFRMSSGEYGIEPRAVTQTLRQIFGDVQGPMNAGNGKVWVFNVAPEYGEEGEVDVYLYEEALQVVGDSGRKPLLTVRNDAAIWPEVERALEKASQAMLRDREYPLVAFEHYLLNSSVSNIQVARPVRSGMEEKSASALVLEHLWNQKNNKGLGYGPPAGSQGVNDVRGVGRLVRRAWGGDAIAVYDNGRYWTLVGDANGPWAVDVDKNEVPRHMLN